MKIINIRYHNIYFLNVDLKRVNDDITVCKHEEEAFRFRLKECELKYIDEDKYTKTYELIDNKQG